MFFKLEFQAVEKMTAVVEGTAFAEAAAFFMARIGYDFDETPYIRNYAVVGKRIDPETVLTSEEIAYCNARLYGIGFDADYSEFGSIQWKHIVEGGVAMCRTRALWFHGHIGQTSAFRRKLRDVVIDCPFCLRGLRREMERRPNHAGPDHGIWSQHCSRFVAATLEGDHHTEAKLLVNGVVARHIVADPADAEPVGGYNERFHSAYDELLRLAAQINAGSSPAAKMNQGPPIALMPDAYPSLDDFRKHEAMYPMPKDEAPLEPVHFPTDDEENRLP